MLSTIVLLAIGALMLVSAAAALLLRNLIHSALLFVLNWLAIAFFYLWAGAEFVAFAQILVYVGAVSMIVLFAVLLTRRQAAAGQKPDQRRAGRVFSGILAAAACFAVLAWSFLKTPLAAVSNATPPDATVELIGKQLAGPQLAALLIIGVLLTVTLLGAVLIAAPDDNRNKLPSDQ